MRRGVRTDLRESGKSHRGFENDGDYLDYSFGTYLVI